MYYEYWIQYHYVMKFASAEKNMHIYYFLSDLHRVYLYIYIYFQFLQGEPGFAGPPVSQYFVEHSF